MTVKVRSSEGEQLSNDTTPDINSPSSITAGDTIGILWCFNDDVDVAADLTPPSGFGLVGEIFDAGVGDRGMRYAIWTKIADATDATNQGTANYYTFTGMGGVTDILYGIFSLYDDAGGVVRLQAGSLADNFQDDVGGTDTISPTQVILYDGSLCLNGWAARQGTNPSNITASENYAPTGGANVKFDYHDSWISNSQSGLTWLCGTAEFDVADSPIGTQTETHISCASDVDFYSVSMIFEAVSSTQLEVFVGNNKLPTASSGVTNLTSGDSNSVPVGALHCSSRAATKSVVAGDFVLNIGMSDGTLSRAMSTTANDGAVADDATKGYYDGVVGHTTPGAQVEDGLVGHNSFIAGGQRVNNTNGFFAAYHCAHMLFAGCNHAVKEVTLNATVDTVVNVDPGFAWDVVLVTQCQETLLGDEDADNNGSFGFMTKADGAQACIVTGTNNGDASPGGPSLQISNTRAGKVVVPGTGATTFSIDVQEGTGTSCDIYPRTAGGQSVLVALTFIGFTGGETAKIVSWDTPVATGNNAITGAGGTPLALIHLVSRAAAYDTAEADGDAGAMGVSFVTVDSQHCVSAINEFATGGTSTTRNLFEDRSIRVLRDDGNTSTLNSYGSDYVSLDADGWTENWTHVENGAAGKCVSLAFLEAGTETPVGLATETDSAFAVTRAAYSKIAGLATSTEFSLAVDKDKVHAVGLSTETDVALDVTATGLGGPIGLPVEVDEALTVTRSGFYATGLVTEADSALIVTPRHDVDANRVLGTDTALAITAGLATEPTLATETSTALAITRNKTPNLPIIVEFDLAQGVGSGNEVFVGLAAESSSALPVTAFALGAVGFPIEIDVPLSVQANKSYAALGLPSESDTAFIVTINTVLVPADLGWEDNDVTWGGIELSSLDFAPVYLTGMDFKILGYDGSAALDTFLERKAVVFERGATVLGTGVWPDIIGPQGASIQIYLGSHDVPEGAIDWEGPYDFVIGEDDFVDFAVAGRYLAVRFESSGVPSWTLQSYDIDYEVVGRH